jgi:hypothetical protein
MTALTPPRSARLAQLSLSLVLAGAGVALTACGGEAKGPASSPEGAAKGGETSKTAGAVPSGGEGMIAGKPVDGGAGKTATVSESDADGDRYDVVVTTPTDATVGQRAVVSIKVEPKGSWHMNLEYPAALSVEAPGGVTMEKAAQKKADAKRLDEEGAEFEIAFTPEEAGEKSFGGEFKFAVCQDEACHPVKEAVQFVVAAK